MATPRGPESLSVGRNSIIGSKRPALSIGSNNHGRSDRLAAVRSVPPLSRRAVTPSGSSRHPLALAARANREKSPKTSTSGMRVVTPANKSISLDDSSDDDDELEVERVSQSVLKVATCQGFIVPTHPGSVSGEMSLARDHNHPQDRHAIRVLNRQGRTVGHIRRDLALVLARLMDEATQTGLVVSGTLKESGHTLSEISCCLGFSVKATKDKIQSRSQTLVRRLSSVFRQRFQFQTTRSTQDLSKISLAREKSRQTAKESFSGVLKRRYPPEDTAALNLSTKINRSSSVASLRARAPRNVRETLDLPRNAASRVNNGSSAAPPSLPWARRNARRTNPAPRSEPLLGTPFKRRETLNADMFKQRILDANRKSRSTATAFSTLPKANPFVTAGSKDLLRKNPYAKLRLSTPLTTTDTFSADPFKRPAFSVKPEPTTSLPWGQGSKFRDAIPQVVPSMSTSAMGAASKNHSALEKMARRLQLQAEEEDEDEVKSMDWRAQEQELDDMYDKLTSKQLVNVPNIEIPDTLQAELMPYQKDGVRWLVHQETNERNMPFFQPATRAGKQVWHCEITNCFQPNKPPPVRGGILADEMGLGKTIQTISLLLAAPPKTGYGCTLIVCPVSVTSSWDQQIKKFVKEGTLRVEFYQGSNRSRLLPSIRNGQINVLLVSYHTLGSEHTAVFGRKTPGQDDTEEACPKKSKSESIFDIKFHRVVLDEAHTIRTSRTTFFHAVTSLEAERRWALTGTPYVNRVDDFYSLFAFLKVEPLANKNIFKKAIILSLQNGEDLGLPRLRTALAHVLLRRTKQSTNLKLVDKIVNLRAISFEDGSPHKAIYDALFGLLRVTMKVILSHNQNDAMRNYSHIFAKLLRIRQACCSPLMLPVELREHAVSVWSDVVKRNETGGKQLSPQEALDLLQNLTRAFKQTDDGVCEVPTCAVCLTEMEAQQSAILRKCSHVYCEPCITSVLAQSPRALCPLCREPFAQSDVIKQTIVTKAATRREPESKFSPTPESLEMSPKILALLKLIHRMKDDEKGVIFSQFTQFLDLIGPALRAVGHSFTRLDGSMTALQRNEVVREFNSDDIGSPRLILCSLHAAGTGITLTRGNHCFLMDCWWNQAIENQAMDRVHRIGQERPVVVTRLVMKDSLEERIVALQEAKNLQAKGSLEKLNHSEKVEARLNSLKGLLLLDDSE